MTMPRTISGTSLIFAELILKFSMALERHLTDQDCMLARIRRLFLDHFADAYRDEGRLGDSAGAYQRALAIDRDNVAALNGIALILYQSGERPGALVAVDRVLALRPRDPDALFLKGLANYQAAEWRSAVEAWRIYLEVGEFHPAAQMVRPLYAEALRRSGP